MAIGFEGWTGDFTTQLPGRKAMQALVALTTSGGSNIADVIFAVDEHGAGVPDAVFKVNVADPDAAEAFATQIRFDGSLFLRIDLALMPGGKPWPVGPNLVHIAAFNPKFGPESEEWGASTFASVIVAPAKKKPTPPKPTPKPPTPPQPSRPRRPAPRPGT